MQEIQERLKSVREKIDEFKNVLDIDRKKEQMRVLQLKMSEPKFWNKEKEFSRIIEELKECKEDVDSFRNFEERYEGLKELVQLNDSSYYMETLKELESLEEKISAFRFRILFRDKFDQANAILEINSGAGGTEACDWTSMLFRMYLRWAENKGFKTKVLNEVRLEEAGIKNVTFLVEGRYAYGNLKSERGVHRLVRISPFDSNKRRHTSFASVDILPEIKGNIELKINPEDLKIDTFRASGAGGQHVNRTDSAVRITHLPTKIIVSCQNERSQYQNKQTALSVLKAKLYKLQEEQKKKEINALGGDKRRIEWGSQIRSYILHPYHLVKDHRTQIEIPQTKAVLDGEIDKFIYSYLIKNLGDNKKD
ncbi:MAG: peptide chain release factor 2 [Candidatus Omnitrophica bacterium]|nr:peptide chain release factor 2 [Candidatus Omnitrophota bacterium]